MADDKPTEETAEKSSFGHDRLCHHLVKRIDNQFDRSKPNIEPSLVIGLFGEWGSGKSHLLNLIESHYNKNKDTITIPIAFNPWRFEKEDHLIIPLMKTTELSLKKYKKDNEVWLLENAKGFAKGVDKFINKTSRLCAIGALALTGSFKTKASIGVLSVEFNGKDFVAAVKEVDKSFEEIDQAYAEDAKDSEIFDDLTSIYFNFHHKLKEAIGHDKPEGAKINLLFLIDDIDRCLPEKAVEMLESIKLFLDVEGCAFVLAVDDEVVERGIVHRYRDYIFQGNKNGSNSIEQNTAPPITGAEYLEKIIHLPFRLPLPTEKEVSAFLLSSFPEMFIQGFTENEEKQKQLGDVNEQARDEVHKNNDESALLNLFVKAVPSVPRKLIRVVELYQLQYDILKDRGFQSIDVLTLARLVIIQLLAPEIYRFGRQQHQGFIKTLEIWEEDDIVGNGKWLLASRKDEDFYRKNDESDKFIYERQDKPLYELIQTNNASRSNFNIRNLILKDHAIASNLSAYFCYLDESSTGIMSAELSVAGSFSATVDNRPVLKLGNESEFIQYITSERPDAWTTVAGLSGINEGVMSEDLFKEFLAKLDTPITLKSKHLTPEWLSIVYPILPFLTPDKKKVLWGDLEKNLIENLREESEASAKTRLHYGDCLAILGDTRKGVGLDKKGLPDIEWQMVAKGNFIFGDDEQGNKETRNSDAFEISRYPITNQQFQAFVDAEDNTKDAKWWLNMPEDEFDNLTSSNMIQANRPKENVSWYQAIAFSLWLNDKTEKTIRLPTEFEWEKAARGTDGRKYPWGNTFEATKLNSREGDSLGETSTVGLYTEGKSPCGAYDMSGNVWEWCLNKYDNPEEKGIDKSGDSRALRGGSFFNNTDDVRCAFRDRYLPYNRGNGIGFRLVCE